MRAGFIFARLCCFSYFPGQQERITSVKRRRVSGEGKCSVDNTLVPVAPIHRGYRAFERGPSRRPIYLLKSTYQPHVLLAWGSPFFRATTFRQSCAEAPARSTCPHRFSVSAG